MQQRGALSRLLCILFAAELLRRIAPRSLRREFNGPSRFGEGPLNRHTLNTSRKCILLDIVHKSIGANQVLGLTNQLLDITSAMFLACRERAYLAVPRVVLDLTTNETGSVHNFIDVDETNQKWNCSSFLNIDDATRFPHVQIYTIDEVKKGASGWHNDLLAFLMPSKMHVWVPDGGVPVPEQFYGVHFRLETDYLLFSSKGGNDLYFDWLSKRRENKTREADDIIETMYRLNSTAQRMFCMLDCYERAALSLFENRSLPILIATGLGKSNEDNIYSEWALQHFKRRLSRHGFTSLTGSARSSLREVAAVAELQTLVMSSAFLSAWGSSFSLYVKMHLSARGKPFQEVEYNACIP